MATTPDQAYGASDHYLGEKGRRYFAWQGGGGMVAGRINSHKFDRHVKPTDTVLDFGCGGGFLLKNLHCARRIGVEINPYAREHAVGLGIECYADLAEIPDGVADIAVSDHALEHVPFPIGALRQLSPKLKPGGLLALCVPIDNWRHHRRYDPVDENHHLHTWTVQLLGNTLVEAGYEILDLRVRTHAWPGRWTVACYGRLPLWLFDFVCWAYALPTGKGRQVMGLARPGRPPRPRPTPEGASTAIASPR
jgi:SAM-dependent methyltransferase